MYKLFVKTLPFRQWVIAQRNTLCMFSGFFVALIPVINIWALTKVISKVEYAIRTNTHLFVDKYNWAKLEDWAEHVARLNNALRSYLFFALVVSLPYWVTCNALTDFKHVLPVTIGVVVFYILAVIHPVLKWRKEYSYFALWKHAHDIQINQ